MITIVSMQNRNIEPYNLAIVNSLGKEIKSIKNINDHRLSIDISGFNRGLFYINIYRGNVLIGSEKLIVQ